MAERWLTMADVFDPATTMLRIQQIKQAQQQQQLTQMQIQQAKQEQARTAAYQAYKTGRHPVQAAMPPTMPAAMPPAVSPAAPTPGVPTRAETALGTPEQQQLIRGQRKIQNIATRANQIFKAGPKIDGQAIRNLNQMAQKDPDVIATIRAMGFDNISMDFDDKTQTAWQKYTKNYSKQELENLAKQPGGQALAGLPAGRYTIDIDPVTQRIRPRIKTEEPLTGILSEKGLSLTQLIDRSLHAESPIERKKAADILQRKNEYDVSVAQAKVMATMAPPFEQWASEEKQNAYESFMLNKIKPMFARGDRFSKPQFTRGYNAYLKELGITGAEASTRGIKYQALAKSFTRQQTKLNSMEQFVGSLDAQLERIDPLLDNLGRLNARALNVPIVRLKNVLTGDPIERELALKLEEIFQDAGRIAQGSTESVGEMSISAQERYKKVYDPTLTPRALKHLMDVTKIAAHDRVDSMKSVYDKTLNQMEGLTLKKGIKKPTIRKPGKPRFRILAVE